MELIYGFLIDVRHGGVDGTFRKYIEEGKLPLKGELFSRKAKIAEKLRLYREESRRITVSRQRKRGGERSAALYWGIAACLFFFWE